MTSKLPSLYIRTFGKFELSVHLHGVVQFVELSEFDATLLTIVLSTPSATMPLKRLKVVLFPDQTEEKFDGQIEAAVKRIATCLGRVDQGLYKWLNKTATELSLDSAVLCEADFLRISDACENVELLSLKVVTEDLSLDEGYFLESFATTPWIEKKRVRYWRNFQSLLVRQMELYADIGIAGQAEAVAQKVLQRSPFNLSALDVLSRSESGAVKAVSPLYVRPAAQLVPLDIKLFGVGQISQSKVKGATVNADAKPLLLTGYPRKLLAAIICSQDRSSSKNLLFDILWPKATKAQARQRLHVALHELRSSFELIEKGYASFLKSDRVAVSIDEQVIASVDVDLLRTSAQTIGSLSLGDIDQILAATSDEFLMGERELSWITQMRQSCDHQVVKLLIRKAELLLAHRSTSHAKQIAELAFDKYPSSEDACAVLMRCHQVLGSRELAIEAFDRLRRALRDDFDMKASEKIHDLANLIRQNETPADPALSLVEMRSVLATVTPTRFALDLEEKGLGEQSADGAHGGLRRMFLDSLVSTVWVWGPPGIGKKTLIKSVANEFRLSPRCKIHWLETAKILQSETAIATLIDRLGSTVTDPSSATRNVIIATWPTSPTDVKFLVDAIHLADSNALCVFVSQEFPKVKSCVKLRAPGFEAWAHRTGSTDVSPAVQAFCKFAQARGFAELVDRSTVSYLDGLCKYCGGVPGILEELAERLDVSPLNLLQGWLSLQVQTAAVVTTSDSDSFSARYGAYVRKNAQMEFIGNSRLLLEALCCLSSPISLYSLADLVGVSRFEAIACVEALVETGLVTTFRSREFDLVFIVISGFTADIIIHEQLFSRTDLLLKKMVTYYGGMKFPKAPVPGKSDYRFVSEILRFEYAWVEVALDYALRAELQEDVVKLSRLLRRFYFDGGNVEAAAKFFNRALASSTDTNDLADFNTVLGGLYGRAGFGRMANKHLLQALRYSRIAKDEIRECTVIHSLGLSVAASGKFSRGVRFLLSAASIYRLRGLVDRENLVFHGLASIHLNEMKLDFARKTLENSRPTDLANHSQSVASWHVAKAFLAYFEKDFQVAWRNVTIALKIAEEINFLQMSFKAQLMQAILLVSESRPQEAIATLKRSVRQMMFHEYRADAAHAMALLVLSYLMSGESNEALDTQSKAEQLLQNVDDMQANGMVLYSRMTSVLALRLSVDAVWFRTEIGSKWKRLPSYIRKGLSAYEQDICSIMSVEEFAELMRHEDLETQALPMMFESVNQAMNRYASADRLVPAVSLLV